MTIESMRITNSVCCGEVFYIIFLTSAYLSTSQIMQLFVLNNSIKYSSKSKKSKSTIELRTNYGMKMRKFRMFYFRRP